MLIPLVHSKPIHFGADREKGVMVDAQGRALIVDVADVGKPDACRPRRGPGGARAGVHAVPPHGEFQTSPTPIGVFRAVERPDYGTQTNRQLAAAQDQKGPGRLDDLLHSLPTWTVD